MKSVSSPKIEVQGPPPAKTKYLYVRLTPENDAFIDSKAKKKKISRTKLVDLIIEYVRINKLL